MALEDIAQAVAAVTETSKSDNSDFLSESSDQESEAPETESVEAASDAETPEEEGEPELFETKPKKKGANERIRELNSQMKELKRENEALKAQSENPTPLSPFLEALESRYGESPSEEDTENFAWDLKFIDVFAQNLEEIPQVKEAFDAIVGIMKEKGLDTSNPERSSVAEKTAPTKKDTAAKDPRVDAILRERLAERTEKMLNEARIRPELRGLLTSYVTDTGDLDMTDEGIKATLREFVQSNKWDADFLTTGTKSKSEDKEAPLPSLRGQAAEVEAETPTKKGAEKPEPKNYNDIERNRRQRFNALLSESGIV